VQETFITLDANRDGIISNLEWRGKGEEFKRLDSDHNGVITLPEYNQGNAVYRPITK
jgi:Ca2+-binding EF-hand superfamily protein